MGAFMPWHLFVTTIAFIVFSMTGALVVRLSIPQARKRALAFIERREDILRDPRRNS
jgi:hypothetical protein